MLSWEKICPFRCNREYDNKCIFSKCCFYLEKFKGCAIVSIAENMKSTSLISEVENNDDLAW